MLLGLTGGYCAGKNAAASLLEERGWVAIDVDKLGHEAMVLAEGAILERFGPGILGADGRIDHRALGRILFSDPEALAAQEAIVHPIAIRLLDERIAAAEAEARTAGKPPRVCVNAALLYVAPHAARCEAIIEVRAPLLRRLRRAKQRDGLPFFQALARVRRQRRLWEKRKASGRPILILRNDGDLAALAAGLDRLLAGLEARKALHPIPPPADR